jgi:hypothetical protein
MTYDQLIKAQELWKDIVEIKKRIEILQNGYVNSILGWDYKYKSDGERVSFSLDDELREIVIKYLQEKLKLLEVEFRNL